MRPEELDRFREALYQVSYGGGVGFCHDALPDLLPEGHHGPLVLALDSSILLDLQDHGNAIFNSDHPDVSDQRYRDELNALGVVLQVWMLRDIRFIVTPQARVDGKRSRGDAADARRAATIGAISDSLSFQTDEWGVDLSHAQLEAIDVPLPPLGHHDRQLVSEAIAIGAHVFLTRDERLVRRLEKFSLSTLVALPTTVAGSLILSGVGTFTGGGLCESPECPYRYLETPAPDFGKWDGLFRIIGGG